MKRLMIGGCQRTGTTLLQMILNQGAGTVPFLPEPSYFRELVGAYGAGLKFPTNLDFFPERKDFAYFHHKLVEMFFRMIEGQHPEKEFLILKEPMLARLFPVLFEVSPQVRMILMTRDPRDTLAELIKVGEEFGKKGIDHNFTKENLKGLCEYYKSFYYPSLIVTSENFKKSCFVCRYEDLVQNPGKALQDIEKFSEIKISHLEINGEKDLSNRRAFAEIAAKNNPWATDMWKQGISNEAVGIYKEVFSDEEINIIEEACAELMGAFQYKEA